MSATPGDGLPYDYVAERLDAENASCRSGRRIGNHIVDEDDLPDVDLEQQPQED